MTRKAYSFTLPSHYVVIDMEGRATLLDTGIPFSLSDRGSMSVMGREFAVREMGDFLSARSPRLSGLFVDVLGADILSEMPLTIHWDDRKVVFGEMLRVDDNVLVPFDLVWGLPLIHVTIAGQRRSCLLDTGAPLAYAAKTLNTDAEFLAMARDENPFMGEWETPVTMCPVSIENVEFPVPVGRLPNHPMAAAVFATADLLLGTALFRAFDRVSIDFCSGVMVLQPRPGLVESCSCEPGKVPLFSDGRCPWLVERRKQGNS